MTAWHTQIFCLSNIKLPKQQQQQQQQDNNVFWHTHDNCKSVFPTCFLL